MDHPSRMHMLTQIERGFIAETKCERALHGDFETLFIDGQDG
jgi:hypothetical protein